MCQLDSALDGGGNGNCVTGRTSAGVGSGGEGRVLVVGAGEMEDVGAARLWLAST